MALEIAKAGWLSRQSTILKRWKRTWFVLYQDGDLRYFESPNSHEPEARIVVRAVCREIVTGQMVDTQPPDGKTKDCLINLILKDGELKLCAEDHDDMKAWQIALEEARVIPPSANVQVQQQLVSTPYPPTVVYAGQRDFHQYPIHVGGPSSVQYVHYPGQVLAPPPLGTQVVGLPARNVVYVNQDPYYYRQGYDSSYMWGPMLWW